MEHLKQNGFTVQAEDRQDIMGVKQQYKVPEELQACHTAIVDGYVIEGHVPAADIKRLLAERPKIVGLAVPGMPIGSPGMEMADAQAQPYQVIAFDENGKQTVFDSYPK